MSTTTPGTPARYGQAIARLGGGMVVVGFLLAIPIACITYGAKEAVAQDRDLRAARPVVATVVSSRVGEVRGRRGRRRRGPVVVFRYEVGGRQYESDRSMMSAARGLPAGVTAQQFVDARPPGATVQAYYVPGEPWRSSLLNEYDERPYVFIFIGLGLLALFQSGGTGYIVFYPPIRGARPGPAWLALAVRRPLRARVAVNLAQAVVYVAVWGWAAWHYLARVPGPHGVVAHGVIFAFSVPGLWYVFAGARAHFTRRAVSDARVAVKKDGLHVGGEAQVRVEQDLLGEAVPERVRVGLVCEKITRSGKHTERTVCFETWATPDPGPPPTRGGGRGLVFTETLPIPADQPATRSEGDRRYEWKLVVDTALPDCPDYRESFELHIEPAADASGNDAMRPGAGRGKRGRRRRDVRARKRRKE